MLNGSRLYYKTIRVKKILPFIQSYKVTPPLHRTQRTWNLSFGSTDVRGAGTRDEPLRTSVWEARVWGAYILRGLFLEFYCMSLFNKAVLSKYDLSHHRGLFQR